VTDERGDLVETGDERDVVLAARGGILSPQLVRQPEADDQHDQPGRRLAPPERPRELLGVALVGAADVLSQQRMRQPLGDLPCAERRRVPADARNNRLLRCGVRVGRRHDASLPPVSGSSTAISRRRR
jgi:hypothetical protein